MATTIVMVGFDTFDVIRDGKRIARTTAEALSAVDYDIAEVVHRAKEQPGEAVTVPNVAARVQRPRHSQPASGIIQ